ncbi:MAG: DUF429 domain-containing protein [Myxococcales bacterium]|nr:DUF429 domain-containing protein [Myxococcales bacterium]
MTEGAHQARAFTRYIGINLGGGRGKSTAVARLEIDNEGETPRLQLAEARVRRGHRGGGEDSHDGHGDPLFRDDVLIEYLRRWVDDDTVVAINAPLTLPPCIRCQLPCPGVSECPVPVVGWMRAHASRIAERRRSDPGKPAVTPYTQRAVDLLLTCAGLKPRESLGQGMGPLSARAAYLRRVLSPRLRLHENLIEVHPPATVIRLFGASVEHRLRHGTAEAIWALRKRVLAELSDAALLEPGDAAGARALALAYVWPEVVVRSPHVFDAVIAAYTAFAWAWERWRGPRDLIDGPGSEAEGGARPERSEHMEGRGAAVADAIESLDRDALWLEDGWIWVPPVRSYKPEASRVL